MNKHDLGADVVAGQLDRLAAGDLPEPERRALLAWLDEVPARWRACALAFLEAQTWEQAVAVGADGRSQRRSGADREDEAPAEPRIQGLGFKIQDGPSAATRKWATWLAIAASLLVAFVAGMLAAGGGTAAPNRPVDQSIATARPAGPPGLQLATVSVKTKLDPRLVAQLKLPVEPAARPSPANSIPDRVRKMWERRGYELIEETRYLPAKMPDGRTVMVPVNHVRLRLKGTPVS